MSSKASQSPVIPGLPTQAELAYLAGLLDRGGGFTESGLKIVGPPALRHWLSARFGGTESGGAWLLRRQADLLFLVPRVRPYLTTRIAESEALHLVLLNLRDRGSYDGDAPWREERARLRGAVRAARARTTGASQRPGP